MSIANTTCLSICTSQLFSLKRLLWLVILSIFTTNVIGQTVSDTFDTADIPTNFGTYSSTCNGPLTKLSITLPAGGPWFVNSIDVSYNMTAQAGGFKSHQRSYVRCQNTSTSENTIYSGSGNTGGIQTYNRQGVTIANGNYPGNAILNFEMRAWRTAIGSGCNTSNNKVDIFTWIITVHYSQIANEGSVGIGTITPQSSAILDLSSTTQAFLPPRMTTMERNAIGNPVNGMMIFNLTTDQIEIYINGWTSMKVQSPGVKSLMGGTSNDESRSIQQTSDGGFIVAGNSLSSNTGTLSGVISNGLNDAWIIKINNEGAVQWQKLYGGNDNDYAINIKQTLDNGYIVIGFSNSSNSGSLLGVTSNGNADLWIQKLNANGSIQWQKLYGGSQIDAGYNIDQTPDGGYMVIGYSQSSNTGTLTGFINNGFTDNWILRVDSLGNIIWQKLLGGSSSDVAQGSDLTSDGGVVVVGYSSSSNTGNLSGLTNNGSIDLWVYKLNATGSFVWNKLLGGSNPEYPYNIEEIIDGGFIISGSSSSSNTGTLTGIINNGGDDAWILLLDDSGGTVWQKLLGGSLGELASKAVVTDGDNFFIVGYSSSSNTGTMLGVTNHGMDDNWIMKMNSSGVIIWQKLLGGSQSDNGFDICETNDGGCCVAGATSSSNNGDLPGLINNGGIDSWVYKLDSNGNFH